jgi:hypothetical protein
MADTNAMADIRGINVQKLVTGFADEALIIKKFCNVSKTNAREIRWFQKTAGFLDSDDTTAITASQIYNQTSKALPVVVEASFTRNTSYVKTFFVESPLMTNADIKDTDVDILATNIRDLVRAVERQVEYRIYVVLTENDTPTNIQTIAITNEWDDPGNATVTDDLMKAKEYLRNYNYDAEGAVLLLRPDAYRFMVNWLISQKGSYIPEFASDKVESGVVLKILGIKVVVSLVVTSDKAVVFVPKEAVFWKEFTPITSQVIDEPLIGKKIRVIEEGEALLTNPKAVVFLSNIGPT